MRQAAWGRRIVIALVIVAGWEALFRVGLLNPLIFGSPTLVVRAALTDGGTFLAAFRVTSSEILVAIAISWIGGVLFGLLVGIAPMSALVTAPILSAVIALPLVVLYPVLVALLGIGPLSKVAYGAAAGFFPVALATVIGIRAIDGRFIEMSRAMGASRAQIVFQVELRLAAPAIISGLRVGTSLAIISVIQSEMLASTDGLGFWISYHRSLFNVGQVYLGIILVLVTAAISNIALSSIESRLGQWRALEQASL